MLKGPLTMFALLYLAGSTLVPAQVVPQGGEDVLPPQAQNVGGVLAPVPSEIFRTLDTFKDSNWQAVLHPDLAELRPMGGPPRIALSLGLVIGEGFIAIAADEPDEVEKLGKTALKLARALGVERSVLRRGKSIIDHAEKKEMAAVRREWSGVSADLKDAMIQIKSNPLPQLASLGGWLRGVEALSALISQHYTPKDALLLYQPALLDSFEKSLSGMNAKVRLDPAVVEMAKGITALRPLIGGNRTKPLSKQEVEKVRKISGDLVESISQDN